ncbi:MAG: PDDEXK nuclease domain-containing protein [Bacteroidota bacterium]
MKKITHSVLPAGYREWFEALKSKIRSRQIKAALSVNSELIRLYFEMGEMLHEKLSVARWGSAVIDKLAADLKKEFPENAGFGRINLYYMVRFFRFYEKETEIVQQLAEQIPWTHNVLIFSKVKSILEAVFYLDSTLQNNWSRDVLTLQIESKLFDRQGKALNNFDRTLPQPQADLAKQLLKDPYNFSFLTLEMEALELELEKKLTENIISFLLELGAGFAFLGRQYEIEIGDKTRRIDLLFYHIRLRCFVPVDLKMRAFEPEDAGKMNFYLSAIDDLLKTEQDNPSIGIILCKSKNKLEVEYALRNLNVPIGISEWVLTEKLPENLQSEMPSVEELERELTERLKGKSKSAKKHFEVNNGGTLKS